MSTILTRGNFRKSANKAVLDLLHVIGYYTLLKRPGTRIVRIAGFELSIRPTVYDPRYYRAPEFFAEFIGELDLTDKKVADVGTGSGIQALAAARAGASRVVAIDINPNAVTAAAANARANGFVDRVFPAVSNLFFSIDPTARFDVIFTNPPFCDGKAWDVADRAWRAGERYKDIAPLFEQARARLTPGGTMYMVISSHAELDVVEAIVTRAGFAARVIRERRVLFETLLIYELRPV